MLTFLKFVVGVPFVAVCLLLLVGVVLSIYAVVSQKTEQKEYAAYIENLSKKKAAYSKTARTIVIDDYNALVDRSWSSVEETNKVPANPQKERYKRNKKKRNRKRNKIAKASRKQNR